MRDKYAEHAGADRGHGHEGAHHQPDVRMAPGTEIRIIRNSGETRVRRDCEEGEKLSCTSGKCSAILTGVRLPGGRMPDCSAGPRMRRRARPRADAGTRPGVRPGAPRGRRPARPRPGRSRTSPPVISRRRSRVRKWSATSPTYSAGACWLYPVPVIDCATRLIIGRAMDDNYPDPARHGAPGCQSARDPPLAGQARIPQRRDNIPSRPRRGVRQQASDVAARPSSVS